MSIYVPYGETLSDVIKVAIQGDGPKCVTRAMMKRCLQGIRELHHKLLCHGDLKTENIIFSNGEIFMIDFEQCHTVGPHPICSKNLATPIYAAPETLMSWNIQSPLKDVYSFVFSLCDDFSKGQLLEIHEDLCLQLQDEGVLKFKCIVNRAVHGLWKELMQGADGGDEQAFCGMIDLRFLERFEHMFTGQGFNMRTVKCHCHVDEEEDTWTSSDQNQPAVDQDNHVCDVAEAIKDAANKMREHKVVLNTNLILPVMLCSLAPIPHQRPTMDQIIHHWFGDVTSKKKPGKKP